MSFEQEYRQVADALANAAGLIIGAGAGMGVDSGLPDFRGNEGFWRAYPPFAKLGLNFTAIANPHTFVTDPALAWGFYGHRLALYRRTMPHQGFHILHKWAKQMDLGAFIYTANVDGHFQRAGFKPEQVWEVHGSIHWLQCLARCGSPVFPADDVDLTVDEETMQAKEPLPQCPACGNLVRPNILLFDDWQWNPTRSEEQEERFVNWLEKAKGARLVIMEFGAGKAIPTVRHFCERQAVRLDALLVRFNPRESEVPAAQVGLPVGALQGIEAIDKIMQ